MTKARTTPAPERIDDRDDGLILWRFTLAAGATVDFDAADEAAATAKFDEWQTLIAAPQTPAPNAVEIANVLVDAVTTAADFDAAKANLAAAQAGLPPTAAATKTGKTARGK